MAPWPWRFVAISAALSVVGIVSLLLMTRWGIGTSPDSVGYLQAARSIVVSGTMAVVPGDATGEAALTHFAPLYSFLLAAGGLVDVDPFDWGRWLNALLFGGNVLLAGAMTRFTLGNSAGRLWMAGAVLVLVSAPMLGVHVTMLSEPLFILLTFVGIWLLASYLATSSRTLLGLAAVAIGLAWLTRYAGAACVITGGIALLTFPGRRLGRRVWDAALFGAVSSAGLIAWLARNAAVSNSATGRDIIFHPIDRSHLWQAFYTASGWLLIPAPAPDWVRVIAWCTLGGLAAATLVFLQRAAARPSAATTAQRPETASPILVRLLALFVVTYMAFLAVSISFFDANTPLDDRILSPVYVAAVVLALWIAQGLWTVVSPRPVLARLMLVGLVAFLGAQIAQGARLVAAGHARGWGFSNRSWQASPTLERVRQLPETVLVYSNAPELVYLHAGRKARGLPKRWSPMNRQPNPGFPAQMAALERALAQEPAVVVHFTGIRSAPARGELNLATELPLRIRDRQSDGVIFCAAICPE